MCKKGQEQLPVPTLQTRITCIQIKNNHPFPCFGNRLKIAEHGNNKKRFIKTILCRVNLQN